jgi:hypothetical protein
MTRFPAALTFATALLSFAPVPLVAQTQPQPPAPPPGSQVAAPAGDVRNAQELRQEFREVLNRYPRSVGSILRLDPTLFGDAGYLASYPELAEFVARHPEVARNAEYYLAGYASGTATRDPNAQAMEVFRNFLEGITIVLVIATIAAALLWLIRAIVDHRRWLRVSKIQTDVHTKLLDRFSSSEELLAYMRTPAGAKFLESAPIAVDASTRSAVGAPVSRILWSVQAGIVILLAGLALLVARRWFGLEFGEVRTMLAMMGTVAAFIGLGFIVSAGASWALALRFGLIDGTGDAGRPSVTPGRIDSAGL